MLPMRTDRLTIRSMQLSDAAVVAAYRADPEVSALQDWPLPYTQEMFSERFERRQALGPLDDFSHGTNVAIELDGAVVGDLYVSLVDGIAEVGWTLATHAQGKGIATEAAGALIEMLFNQLGAHRVHAALHPDNIPSMRLCEAIGLVYERVTKLTFLGRNGEWEDDAHYAITRDEWAEWAARPRHEPTEVTLVEITPDDAHLWGRLVTDRSQERFVSPMLRSFRDALFPEVVDGAPVVPWLRGVMANGERVAFVMLAEVTAHHPEPYLWRLLVDRRHQRRGIGRRTLAVLTDQLRAEGHATLLTSWGEGPGSPRRFYERLGFVPTGRVVDDETEARLIL